MAAASERDAARGSDGAPEAGRSSGKAGWLIQALCLAFAVFVIAADVGYCLSSAGLAPRQGHADAVFDTQGVDGYVLVRRVEPGGAMAGAGVAAGDRVGFDRPWDFLRLRYAPTAGEVVGFTLDHSGRKSHHRIVVPALPSVGMSRLLTSGLASNISLSISALFGAFIIWRSQRQATVLLLGMALVTFGLAEVFPPFWLSDPAVYEFWLAVTFIDVYWAIPVLFYAFALQFFQAGARPAKAWERTAFWIYALSLFVLTAARSFAVGRAVSFPVPGGVDTVDHAVSDLGLAFCLAYLFLGWRRSTANVQQRYAFLLVGASAFALAQVLDNFVDISVMTPFMAVTIVVNVVAPALFAYAILRHKVLDLGFAVNRTIVYGMVSVILLAAFGLIEWAVDHFVPVEGREKNVLVDAAVAVGVFLTFHRVRDGVEHVVERLFFRRWQKAEVELRRFVKEAAFATRPETLTRGFASALTAYAEGAPAAIYLLAPEGGYRRATGGIESLGDRLDADDKALLAIRAEPKALVLDAARTSLKAALAAPMVNRNEVIGLALLGPKPSGSDFRPDEVELISWAARQMGLDLHALELEQLQADKARQAEQIAMLNAKIEGLLAGRAPA